MKIYFIRHGFAYHNLGAKLYGDAAYSLPQYRDAELTLEGIDHAKQIGKTLKNVKFNRIFSSPNLRCIQTTNNFIDQNLHFNNNLIILDDKLMEPQGKHLCNQRKDRIALEKYLQEFSKTFDFKNVLLNYYPNIYESKKDTQEKVISFIEDLKKNCSNDEIVLVVSHYGWLYNFFEIATGKGYEFFNCEVKIIELNNS